MQVRHYHDDPAIRDDAELWRRIPPWHFFVDENLGRLRPSSAAFDDDGDGDPMSVLIADRASGPDAALLGHKGFALAAITAGLARQCDQGVSPDPTPTEPAHAKVFALSGHRTKSVMRRMAYQSRWVVEPPPR